MLHSIVLKREQNDLYNHSVVESMELGYTVNDNYFVLSLLIQLSRDSGMESYQDSIKSLKSTSQTQEPAFKIIVSLGLITCYCYYERDFRFSENVCLNYLLII